MLSKAVVIAAAGIAAANAQACTNPTPFTGVAVTSPDAVTFPTIGTAFDVVWDPTGATGPITLILLSGCPANCVPVQNIATNVANSGTFSWTPACTLAADTTAETYGIKLVDESLCEYQYSTHFGLHADTAGVCNAVSSPTSTAASPTSTLASSTTTTATTATGTTTTPASSATSLATSKTKTVSPLYPTGSNGTNSGSAPTLTQGGAGGSSGPAATASNKPQSNDSPFRPVSYLGGAAAIFGAALML